MTYAHSGDDIYCALYAGNRTVISLSSGKVALEQKSGYPFSGNISMEVTPENDGAEFTIWLRIPAWAREKFVPGELYSYADGLSPEVKAAVNGKAVRSKCIDGYIPVRRAWKAGDKLSLELPMPVRYSVADPRVKDDLDRVCITRGPLVYCAEQPDNLFPAPSYIVDKTGQQGCIDSFKSGILKGISSITLDAAAADENGCGQRAELKLIPYYAWNNRGDGVSMNVWFARSLQTATAHP